MDGSGSAGHFNEVSGCNGSGRGASLRYESGKASGGRGGTLRVEGLGSKVVRVVGSVERGSVERGAVGCVEGPLSSFGFPQTPGRVLSSVSVSLSTLFMATYSCGA